LMSTAYFGDYYYGYVQTERGFYLEEFIDKRDVVHEDYYKEEWDTDVIGKEIKVSGTLVVDEYELEASYMIDKFDDTPYQFYVDDADFYYNY